ncbi:YchF/TatD family DNA exonuclease [Bowmanella denitrificans]|uniref:YchF/TatD family DNA exonuclease n=1 Tax=Bowmanella denitrificans TaxID=366582 RepID=A0ABN0WRX0_9ALTE
MFIDSHCHLDRLDKSPQQLQELVQRARDRGVKHFLCVCVAVNEYETMLETVKDFADVSVSCGVHPLHQEDVCSYEELLSMASREEVVAIGETGLDYHYSPDTKGIQQQSFIDHIKVANKLHKPLIIHTRDARQDTIALLKQYKAPHTKGVLHCFTEDLGMARQAIELGLYISISGIVTFKAATELQDVVRQLPLERLLIETDSPWLAPVPYRGKPNEPAYVKEVAQFIADLKEIPVQTLADATTHNFYQLFERISAT